MKITILCIGLCVSLFAFGALAHAETLGLNFTGSTYTESGFYPPDTMGAVGSDHVVELINGRYAAYSASTGTLVESSSLDTFWTNAGATPSGSYSFDPRILYDASSSRWFATAVDNAAGANNFLFAVSTSSDPTAGWTGFKIDSDTDDSHWADFPTMGVDADGVYVAANMFSVAPGGATRTSVLVLPKADLLAGAPSVAGATLFEDLNPSTTGYSIQPVVNLDGGGAPSALLSAYNIPAGFVKVSTLNGPVTAPTLDTAGGFIPVPASTAAGTAAQPGGADEINTGGARFSGNVVQVDGNIWAVDTVDEDGRAAIRWYRFDAITKDLLETGLIADPTLEYYYPSIAVNTAGNIIIGMSGSSVVDYASAYAVEGRFSGGATAFDSVFLTQAGVATYERTDGSGRNRWGDYSATVLDPDDLYTFWTFQEFAYAQNVWGIQITQIHVDRPVPEPASLALMALGVAGVAAVRRRRTRAGT